jgi:hypothetical protein
MKVHTATEDRPERLSGQESGLIVHDPPSAGRFLQDTSVKTLANWRCDGIGPPFIKIGGKVAYFEKDLIAFLESRRFSSTTDYTVRATKRKKNPSASECQAPPTSPIDVNAGTAVKRGTNRRTRKCSTPSAASQGDVTSGTDE